MWSTSWIVCFYTLTADNPDDLTKKAWNNDYNRRQMKGLNLHNKIMKKMASEMKSIRSCSIKVSQKLKNKNTRIKK